MTDIRQYLDSTYLKTAEQTGLTEAENAAVAREFIQEAIDGHFKLIMIRPEMVSFAKAMVEKASSKLLVGTVIDFPFGLSPLEMKMAEAEKAIEDGADDLDFVCNYEAFKIGDVERVRDEILQCTALGLAAGKTVKWIIEVAALDNQQIVRLSALIKNVVVTHFKEDSYASVFVKSSTGFYKTQNNLPNGATIPTITMMIENAYPLPVKAAGGVRSFEEAEAMIRLGVKRIGTSSAKAIAEGKISKTGY
ncbi:deoxyribose-phosphate aldolase [Flavobacterium pallidum]|uniref:Deoxyribose-phosphate aldolase n=1 Tax=Flavobacterium pallidum TaxID=2172098 RepID=A0A2S1SGD0_9FLAO|nr:deoxyribose-phosphate aldolase [Flavobacterium pallidum]AWI25397.1 deoxyribose-phosphate aldolase [Flavobacterium pallidum]